MEPPRPTPTSRSRCPTTSGRTQPASLARPTPTPTTTPPRGQRRGRGGPGTGGAAQPVSGPGARGFLSDLKAAHELQDDTFVAVGYGLLDGWRRRTSRTTRTAGTPCPPTRG